MTKTFKTGVLTLLLAAVLAFVYWLYSPMPSEPEAAVQELSIEFEGRERSFLVVLPQRAESQSDAREGVQSAATDDRTTQPAAAMAVQRPSLAIVMHPSQSSAHEMRRMIGHVLEPLAQSTNTVLVYPDGFENHFNDCRKVASYSARTLNINDVGFLETIIERMRSEHNTDPSRVAAMGYSNGAHMALRLALERPGLLSGIGMIAANFPTPDNLACDVPNRIVSNVVLVQGTEDPINPWKGGQVTLFGFGDRGQVLSAPQSAEWFAKRIGLPPAKGRQYDDEAGLTAQESLWASRKGTVRLVSILGGGHTVPQSKYRYPRLFGATFSSDQVLTDLWAQLLGAPR